MKTKDIMRARYKIAPQMREYDKIGQMWLPYLMYFHDPDYSSEVLNTDSRGFRITYKGKERIFGFDGADKFPVCLLVGGSSVFGVGATHDKKTIPSLLNDITGYLWLNFGGRAFSSTQEFILFMFYHQQIKNIRKIVILSGLNNLILFYLSKAYPKEIGSFFFLNQYNQKMNSAITPARRKLMQLMLKLVLKKKIDSSRKDAVKEDLLHVLERDILNWRLLASSLGIELYYILQPMANWINKELSVEEKLLFAELDRITQNHWKVLKNHLGHEQYAWFLEKVRGICGANNINFFDMNELLSEKQLHNEWIFVDRVHLTDAGNMLTAQIIKEKVFGK